MQVLANQSDLLAALRLSATLWLLVNQITQTMAVERSEAVSFGSQPIRGCLVM